MYWFNSGCLYSLAILFSLLYIIVVSSMGNFMRFDPPASRLPGSLWAPAGDWIVATWTLGPYFWFKVVHSQELIFRIDRHGSRTDIIDWWEATTGRTQVDFRHALVSDVMLPCSQNLGFQSRLSCRLPIDHPPQPETPRSFSEFGRICALVLHVIVRHHELMDESNYDLTSLSFK